MKTVLLSILALLLGVAVGWRHDRDPAPVAAGLDAPVGKARAPEVTAEGRARADEVVGEGWRGWADRVGAAANQAELEALFAALMETENQKLWKSVGELLGARWAEVDPGEGARFLSEAKGGTRVLYPLLTEWVMAAVVTARLRQDREAAIATVDSLPPGGVRLRAGRTLVMAMMPKDPAAAVERALSDQRMGFDMGRSNWSRLGASLGGKEPDVVRELLADPPEGLSPVFEQCCRPMANGTS